MIETDTPFSSIGKPGARFDSDAFAGLTVTLVTAPKLPCAELSSPAANPVGFAPGLAEGLGEGLGLGVGLTLGLGVAVGLATGTEIKLAPVNKLKVAVDTLPMSGDNW